MSEQRTYISQKYIRFPKVYTINDVLPFISQKSDKKKKFYDENEVKMFSLRLKTFAIHGIICVTCGLQGEFFALEQDYAMYKSGNSRYHFNLYAKNEEGTEILFTKDHILPKSKGGKDNLNNTQTMCIICNGEKADNL